MKQKRTSPDELESIHDPGRATVLMHPLRLRILSLAKSPASATELAGWLQLPRQKVNYHVRQLARARFLRRAGQRRKRNLIERCYQASARSYVLAPEVLGPLAADWRQIEDTMSAQYLIALGSLVQRELTQVSRGAQQQGKRLPTLSMASELRFESAEQRESFSDAFREALVKVIAEHSSPALLSDGRPGPGRPYRMVMGCYPLPKEDDDG